jgi:hypothetical protein
VLCNAKWNTKLFSIQIDPVVNFGAHIIIINDKFNKSSKTKTAKTRYKNKQTNKQDSETAGYGFRDKFASRRRSLNRFRGREQRWTVFRKSECRPQTDADSDHAYRPAAASPLCTVGTGSARCGTPHVTSVRVDVEVPRQTNCVPLDRQHRWPAKCPTELAIQFNSI